MVSVEFSGRSFFSCRFDCCGSGCGSDLGKGCGDVGCALVLFFASQVLKEFLVLSHQRVHVGSKFLITPLQLFVLEGIKFVSAYAKL